MCYVNGTTLTIAGNGSGRIYMNPDSSFAFSGSDKASQFLSVTEINGIELLDTSKVTTMKRLFAYCDSLKILDVSNFDTSKVTDMQFAFGSGGLSSTNMALTNIKGIENLDTSNVTTMFAMFQECSSLKELDVSKWDTGKVTDMGFMFYKVNNLTSRTVDVSNWDVSKVTSFDHMFAHSSMKDIDVSKWDTSSATNMYALFHTVRNTSIDVSSFDTSKVTVFGQMFEYMTELKEIKGLENFDTSKGVDFDEMFCNCSKLTKLDLSSFDTRNATFKKVTVSANGGVALSTWHMFDGMTSLQEIKLGENFTFKGDGTTKSGYNYGVLPTPGMTGADGNWYNEAGTAFAPADVPGLTADTYYAIQ